jgi:hypothetical protein
MPDISMCRNESCKSKYKCFRYTAIPGFWQAYSSFGTDKCESCDRYMDNEGTIDTRTKKKIK